MIVVTGVTGKLGKIVINDLLERVPASELAAVARTPAKAQELADRGVQVRAGDYDDPASLESAFAGADVLLFVSGPDITPGVRPRQHGNVVDAAKAAGVGRVVYTSAIGAQDGPGFLADHTHTEGLLRDSGLPHTVLRNTFYTEALVNPGLAENVESGELVAADAGQPVNFATIRDLALAASATLTGDGHVGAVYELRGPVWTLADLAGTVGEVAGTTVTYRPVPLDELEDFPAFLHGLIATGLFAEPSDDLEKLLGRPATTLREAVAAALR
ncbi:SDR family oxidoreductase [Actinomycetes bacterium KLBMP 9759]